MNDREELEIILGELWFLLFFGVFPAIIAASACGVCIAFKQYHFAVLCGFGSAFTIVLPALLVYDDFKTFFKKRWSR